MVRNIVVLGGSSHKSLNDTICSHLGIPPSDEKRILLSKFSVGETRVEIKESVRGKDVYIIQSGGGKINDHLMELLITISACKTASAKRVTAVLPLFPYSKQSDVPYNKSGAPLAKVPTAINTPDYTFESRPQTPFPGQPESQGLNGSVDGLTKRLAKPIFEEPTGFFTPLKARYPNGVPKGANGTTGTNGTNGTNGTTKRSDTGDSSKLDFAVRNRNGSVSTSSSSAQAPPEDTSRAVVAPPAQQFQPQPGYKQWVAQAGTLVAGLLTCAGADHIITMDLHDPQYQGFFDIPVDNLYARPLLKNYIQYSIPGFREAVVVSPDAGGAKRATAIADQLGMDFALIHKERRPIRITDRQNATMMLVGNVAGRTAILVDDLADTANTITRAAKLLKKEGATMVYALLTHGVLSGDAIQRINASALDKVIVTNSVPQEEHQRLCPKLYVLDVGTVFAEAIRRVHHGESISVLFQYD